MAVIGAGASGLVAIKELIEENHQVICFDKSKDLGGVYRYDADNIGVYESAQLTSSAFITAFSDFPPPPNAPFHFYHHQYFQYLHDYAQHFRLMPLIKFNQSVKNVQQLPDGRWTLTAFDHNNQREEQYTFDAVAVCAGIHQNPSTPDLPHQERFKGIMIHSGRYKTAEAFHDKNVVIIGGGESGSDIVEEVSKVAKSCVLSLRRGALVVPRLIFDRPNDFYTNRFFYTIPPWLFRIRHKSALHWPMSIVILLFLVLGYVHLRLMAVVLNNLLFFLPILSVPVSLFIIFLCLYLLAKAFKYILMDIGLKEIFIISRFNRQSEAGHGEQFATKCEGMIKAIARKKCILKPMIKQFLTAGVEFTDGTSVKADAVIFCTGYKTRFPFLAIDQLDCRSLYKNCFDPQWGSGLCFIGLARPAIGAIPPIAEMQARWFARLLSGQCQLPPKDSMEEQIKSDAKKHKESFSVVSDRITGLVDFTSYMDQLAEYVGCKPRWKELMKDPLLLYKIYGNPFLACQYRLFGPHQKTEIAKQTIRHVHWTSPQLLYNYFLLWLVVIYEILYRLGFSYFKPNLRLPD